MFVFLFVSRVLHSEGALFFHRLLLQPPWSHNEQRFCVCHMNCSCDSVLEAASFKLRSFSQAACLSHSMFLSQPVWTAVRVVLACYAMAILIWSLVESGKFYMTFLTDWMLIRSEEHTSELRH